MLRLLIFSIFIAGGIISAAGQSDETSEPGPDRFVYGIVVNNSGTFRIGLERAVGVLAKVAEANSETDSAFVITYAGADKIRLRQESTDDSLELADAILNLYAEAGSGALLDAIRLGAEQLIAGRASADGHLSLVIATDGDARDSAAKPDELLKYLLENRVRLHVLVIADARSKHDALDRLIRGTGGKKYMVAGDPDALAAEIARDIRAKD